MTFQIDGVDIMAFAQVASIVGSIIAMLIVGLLVYLMVRPPRHVRKGRRAAMQVVEADPGETEQLWRLVDRMELRLETLERLLDEREDRPAIGPRQTETILTPAENAPATGGRHDDA